MTVRDVSAATDEETINTVVLLVEDSRADAVLTERALSLVAGRAFDLMTAETVAEAIGHLESLRPDVVLLDLELPDATDMSGVETILKAAPEAAVIVLTGREDDTVGQAAVQRGAQDYLRKSELDPDSLGQAIDYAIYRATLVKDLHVAERRFHGLFSNAPVPMCCIGLDGRLLEVNHAFVRMTGYGSASLVGRLASNIVHPDDAAASTNLLNALLGGERDTVSYEERVVTADGDTRYLRVSAGVVRDDNGVRTHVSSVCEDITEQRMAERAVTRSEGRFRSLVQNVSDVISVHDQDGRCSYMSASGLQMLGLTPEDVLALRPDILEFIHPDDRSVVRAAFASWIRGGTDQVDYRSLTATGEWIHCESVAANLMSDPNVEGIVVTTRDITERKRAEEALAHQALHDGLTGLPNRTLFVDRLEHALARAPRVGGHVAVLFLDLDNFKLINDSFGHHAGDEVLTAAAKLLESAMRPGDTIARLGGDEFGVVCEGIIDVADAEAVAERLGNTLRLPFGVSGHAIHVSTSIGIALSDDQRRRGDELLQDADVALYRAKDSGRSCAAVFDDDLKARGRRRLHLEDALRGAVSRQEMSLAFQPQINLATGRLVGFEALLRWHHPEFGEVAPDEFIAIMEQTDLIFSIGRWALERAVDRIADWRRRLNRLDLSMAVNLSARQVADPRLPTLLASILNRAGLDPGALCLELTESIVMDDAESSVHMLRSLKQLGVRIAIDDFGTGYSSLAYLKRFPVDYLKVDRTFVSGLGRDPEDTVIVASVVDLGRSLGLEVVAEGVETETQLAELVALGCSFGQGHYWSKPVPAAQVEHLIMKADRQDGVLVRGKVHAALTPKEAPEDPGDVLATVAHELRNPVTIIRGFAETLGELIRSDRTDVLESALDAIKRQTQGMEHVLASLADARAIDTGTLALDTAPVDVGPLVAQIVEDAATGIKDHPIHTTVHGSAQTVVDPNRLRQIVVNLVSNAARYSPLGAPVEVIVESDENEVRIRVIDRGPGISPDRLGELFRKFSRLDRRGKGTGLGLFLARTLARAHGGDVVYRRASTGGAEFTVVLPLASATQAVARPADPVPARGERHHDGAELQALYTATRAVWRGPVPEAAVGAAIALVVDLGGRLRADPDHDDALPFDLSAGFGDPLYAVADPLSVTRSRLAHALPLLLEDARPAIEALAERSAATDPCIDRLTGLPKRKGVHLPVDEPGLVMVVVDLDGHSGHLHDVGRSEAARTVRALARAARAAVRPSGHVARDGDDSLLLWGHEGAFDVSEVMDRLWTTWEAIRPHPLTYSYGAASASASASSSASETGADLLKTARRALVLDAGRLQSGAWKR